MKNFVLAVVALIGIVGIVLFCGFKTEDKNLLRIHVRANSNNEQDQSVKYEVVNALIDFITPLVAMCETLEEAKIVLKESFEEIEFEVEKVLTKNGFTYNASVAINNEYFPTRTYDEWTLESGFYEALIVNLGSGEGDNWWCVVYPPLCFRTNAPIKYKSIIVEIIKNWIK